MRYSDLKAAVARLGFQTQLEPEWEGGFRTAVNMALLKICRRLPIKKSAKIIHSPLAPIVSDRDVSLDIGEYTTSIPDCGGILIELTGCADLHILSADGVSLLRKRIGKKNPTVTVSKIMVDDLILAGASHDIVLSLKRYGTCIITRLDAFGADAVSEADDMQFCDTVDGMRVYDLSAFIDDFDMAKVVSRNGYRAIDYRFSGRNLLLVPENKPGTYEVEYVAKTPVVGENEDDDIPLPDDEMDLLVYLTASLVLLDEGDGMAQYYEQKYEEETQRVIQRRQIQRTRLVRDEYNW